MPRFSQSELIKLQKKFKTDAAIGKEFNITRQAVHSMRKVYGISPIPGARTVFKPPRLAKDELIRLQKTLVTDGAIGERFRVSANAVLLMRKKYGIPAIYPNNAKRNAKIIALSRKGMTGTAIAKKFGMSISYACKIIEKANEGRNGVAKRPPAKKSPPRHISKAELINLQRRLKTDAAIAERFGILYWSVYKMRKKYGIPALIPDYIVRNKKIVGLYKKGTSGASLAKEYDLSNNQIYNIIRNAGVETMSARKKKYRQL